MAERIGHPIDPVRRYLVRVQFTFYHQMHFSFPPKLAALTLGDAPGQQCYLLSNHRCNAPCNANSCFTSTRALYLLPLHVFCILHMHMHLKYYLWIGTKGKKKPK